LRRFFLFLVFVTLFSLGLAFLAETPGHLSLVWAGYRFEMSTLVATAILAAFVFLLIVLIQILRAVFHGPEAFRMFLNVRRKNKGLEAIARGLVAVGAWDVRQAQRAAKTAQAYLGDTPLTLLLRSQTAQLTGDKVKARASFEAMLQNPMTRLLGLRGLYVEAQRAGDAEGASAYAEAAAKMKTDLPWASSALLITQARTNRWDDVLETVKNRQRHRMIDRSEARRLRAIALTAKAKTLLESHREQARSLSMEAYLLDPALAPAAVQTAQLYAESEDFKSASKVLEKAWKTSPHPSIAHLYINLRKGDTAKDRLKRAQNLLRLKPNEAESLIAYAAAAAEAREFALARNILQPLLAPSPTQRICLLMSKLAEAEHDIGLTREWLDRAMKAPRDAVWMADGRILSSWEPISPVSGELGAVQWKIPQEEPRGLILLQEQMPNIPAPLPSSFSERPISRLHNSPQQAVKAPIAATPPPTPFVPDDPGPEKNKGEDEIEQIS
jgi:HemY protein